MGPPKYSPISGATLHRVAIANSRIQDCDDDHVAAVRLERLRRNGGAVKTMRLKPDEFIRSFPAPRLAGQTASPSHCRHFDSSQWPSNNGKLAICRSLVMSQVEPIRQGKEETPAAAAAGGNQLRSSTLSRMRRTPCEGSSPTTSLRWPMLPLTDVAVLVRHVMSATTTIPSTPSLLAFSALPAVNRRPPNQDLRAYLGGAACMVQRADTARFPSSRTPILLPIARQNTSGAFPRRTPSRTRP